MNDGNDKDAKIFGSPCGLAPVDKSPDPDWMDLECRKVLTESLGEEKVAVIDAQYQRSMHGQQIMIDVIDALVDNKRAGGSMSYEKFCGELAKQNSCSGSSMECESLGNKQRNLIPIVYNGDNRLKCPKCGSTQVRKMMGIGKVVGCVHPGCGNYHVSDG